MLPKPDNLLPVSRPKSSAYDLVFLGAGCASLSLLLRLLRSGRFHDKKILLIDRDRKEKNDRTWCFWEKEEGFFEEIVFRKWETLAFHSDTWSSPLHIRPYVYKMIRAIDFYQYCFSEMALHPNVELLSGDVRGARRELGKLVFDLDNRPFSLEATTVFNSFYHPSRDTPLRLLQHFKGWLIETAQPVFEPTVATLMDFRVTQKYGDAFVYVMPFSENQALVEFTLFTKQPLSDQQYEEELSNYIRSNLGTVGFSIHDKESGIIPMTSEKLAFWRDGMFHLGTAGGRTKASTGYTFQFIQKHSDMVSRMMISGESLAKAPAEPKRFRFYDNTLLDVLYHGRSAASIVFGRLFNRNRPQQVLKFLDNETSPGEELKIISSLPIWPFLRAGLRQL